MESRNLIIQNVVLYVKYQLKSAEGGHDWWHTCRVWNLAKKIAMQENGDLFVVELGALLHDIADAKFHNNNEDVGPEIATKLLESLKVEKNIIDHVVLIIRNISFRGGLNTQQFRSPELDIVQDADRLDALGAIGVARTFNYGGYKGREVYNPEIPPKMEVDKIEYLKGTSPSINHFYEKLLLLRDKMNTETGKLLAKKRHDFLITFLDQFFSEWEESSGKNW